MKYLNPLNILLAGLSVLVVGYALTRTIWAPEGEADLNIQSLSSEPRSSARPTGSLPPAPERRSVGSRRGRADSQGPLQVPDQAAEPALPAEESDPADLHDAPPPVPPGSGATTVISTSTTPTSTGREAENSPEAQPASRALGGNRPARQPRALSRLPRGRGRAGLPEAEKRDRQDGPSSPPVRSSFPAERLP